MTSSDSASDSSDSALTLSPRQAADLLGINVRSVYRYIASGTLAGTCAPYATTRAAVDAFRRQQQGLSGDVLDAPHTRKDSMEVAHRAVGLVETLVPELSAAREQVERLARDNGRLEVELTHVREELERTRAQLPAPRPRRSGLARLLFWTPAP